MASLSAAQSSDEVVGVPTVCEETIDVCVSDSAIGSELVEDDVSVPLSVASLSDDDEDDENENVLSETQSSFSAAPADSFPRSPSKTQSGELHDSARGSPPPPACSEATSLLPLTTDQRLTAPCDANDNETCPATSVPVPTSNSPCDSCLTQTAVVNSDSRDDDDDARQATLRQRRPSTIIPVVVASLSQPSGEWPLQHTTSLYGHQPLRTGGVEEVTSLARDVLTSTDHLADSCDEDDAVDAGGATAGVESSERNGAISGKLNSTEEDDDDVGSRNGSFNKWDPSSWPSWFERLFANGVTSCETSLDEDGGGDTDW